MLRIGLFLLAHEIVLLSLAKGWINNLNEHLSITTTKVLHFQTKNNFQQLKAKMNVLVLQHNALEVNFLKLINFITIPHYFVMNRKHFNHSYFGFLQLQQF